jgi:hypothetical protein
MPTAKFRPSEDIVVWILIRLGCSLKNPVEGFAKKERVRKPLVIISKIIIGAQGKSRANITRSIDLKVFFLLRNSKVNIGNPITAAGWKDIANPMKRAAKNIGNSNQRRVIEITSQKTYVDPFPGFFAILIHQGIRPKVIIPINALGPYFFRANQPRNARDEVEINRLKTIKESAFPLAIHKAG